MSVADKMSQAYVQGAEDQKRQQSQELEALRELCDDQARIIVSLRSTGRGQARVIASLQKAKES